MSEVSSPPESDVVPKGWTAADADTIDDFDETPEERAENARVEERKEIVLPLINTIVPFRTLEQHQISVKFRLDWLGEDDILNRAQSSFKKEQSRRNNLAITLARTSVPQEELEGYIKTLFTIEKNLSSESEGIDPFRLEGLASDIRSLDLAHVVLEFSERWKDTLLHNSSDEQILQRKDDFMNVINNLTGVRSRTRSSTAVSRSETEMRKLFASFIDVYKAGYALPDDETNKKISKSFIDSAITIGLANHDPEQTRKAIEIFNRIKDHPDKEVVDRFIKRMGIYGKHHGLTSDSVYGLTEKLLPAMGAHDPQVAMLTNNGNISGVVKGDFGAADFMYHSFGQKITSSNINELLMIVREIPTSNLARLEQNRRDGLTLAEPFGALRDFIHDQRPGVHDVLAAMVNYYDTGDEKQLLDVVSRTDPGYVNQKERIPLLLDRSRYDTEKLESAVENPNPQVVKPIDVLRRLSKNTEPISDDPPQTSDSEFNRLMQIVNEASDKKSALEQVFTNANAYMQRMMQRGEIGIEPNHILAYGWLEQQGFKELQKLQYEDQMVAYKQSWFQSILRFQELTASSGNFDEQEFHQFLEEVTRKPAKEAYKMISQRVLNNVGNLVKKYKEEGKEKWIGALWSGNISHELIGLTDLRPAETAQGKKHRQELLLPEHDRLRGD